MPKTPTLPIRAPDPEPSFSPSRYRRLAREGVQELDTIKRVEDLTLGSRRKLDAIQQLLRCLAKDMENFS